MKKTTLVIIIAIVLIGTFVGYRIFQKTNEMPYKLATVQKGTIVQEIYTSGKVESPTIVSLQFKSSDKLKVFSAKVGEKVVAGEFLAKQDTSELNAQLAEMQAGIDVQKAKLNQLLSGASKEDITVAETEVANAEVVVANAKQSLEDAKQKLVDKIKDTYTKSDDAIRNKTDQFFSNPRSNNPKLFSYLVVDNQLKINTEQARLLLENNVLLKWKVSLEHLTIQSNLDEYSKEARENLDQVVLFLDKAALVVNSATVNSNISQTTLDKWRSDIYTARTNVNTSISNFSSAEEKLKTKKSELKTAEGNLKKTQDQLALKKAPARSTDIRLFEAQIKQANASMQRIQAKIRERTLIAPSSGIITETNGEVGEIIGPETIAVKIIPDGVLQIKVDVSEADIVNIKIGQNVRITLDSFGDDVSWPGKISQIDPAETEIGGAVYYKTTVIFKDQDERIKPGMTANVWVTSAKKENVIFLPTAAIKEKKGEKFVEVLDGNQVIKKEVKTGIKGTGGVIEILSGLRGGEKVIVGVKK
jgi:HlyD family secretion protein